MKKPLVSIIISIYNVEKYLVQCVESITNQTYKNLEIILVNDGSIDNSKKICERYKKADDRVIFINKENGGPSSSREAGMNRVSGQYVMFVDGDDWLDLNTIEECVNKIEDNDCLLFSYCKEYSNKTVPMHVFDNTMVFNKEEAKDKIHRRIFGILKDELKHPERMENIVTCWKKLYKTKIAKKGKYFDSRVVGSCEDGLFNIYALTNINGAIYLDSPFYHYRKRDDSLVNTYKECLDEQWHKLFAIMNDYIDKNNLDINYKEALANRIALSIVSISLNKSEDKKSSVFDKINYIKKYISSEEYIDAVSNFELSNLPFTWKCFMFCAKHKIALPIYIGTVIIRVLLHKAI